MNIPHPLTQRFVILVLVATAFAIGPTAGAANNTFNGTGTSWNAGGNWSTGLTPASTDALLINSSSLASGTAETIDNSFTVQTLSFDTGSNNVNVNTNSTGSIVRTLTLSGGTDALGNVDSVDLTAPATTGVINLGTASGVGALTVALSSTDAINISNSAATAGNITVGSGDFRRIGPDPESGGGTLVLSGTNTDSGVARLAVEHSGWAMECQITVWCSEI